MNKLKQFLRNTRLQNKLLISYLLACLIPLLLTTAVIYHFSVKNLEEESMELALLYSSQIVTNIDKFVEEYDRITKSILVDNDTIATINAMQAPAISQEVDNRLQIRKLLMRIALMRPNVDNIMLLTANDLFYEYSNYGCSVDWSALAAEEWLQAQRKGKEVLFVTSAHFKTYYESQQDGIVVTIGRRLYDSVRREMGLLLIDMNPFDLVEMNDNFKLTRNLYHIRIHVTTADGAAVYDSDVISGKGTWEEIMDPGRPYERNERENIIITDTAHNGALRVEAIIPRKQLMGKAASISVISAAVIGCSIFMIIGLSVVLSRTITRPITELQNKMEQMGEGSYVKVENFQSSDEIGVLIQHYNHMVDKIETLVNDVYLAQIKQKDAKLMALRTQINPHMLYNTLESIRMKALVKGDSEVADMIKILSKMFRASLGKDHMQNTIRNELEYVENYIKLQNVRFQGRFDFRYDADESLLERPIVPLVFQPIVENCVEHGNRGHHQKLEVFLTVKKINENDISVAFFDNGIGMPPEKKEELNRIFENIGRENISLHENGQSIGLRNIAERIYLRYGNRYGIAIKESNENGTVIELLIPVQQEV